MDFPFEGIPTVPPRKDMDRMVCARHGVKLSPPEMVISILPWMALALQAFFCGGCRYRVTAYPDWPVKKVCGSRLVLLALPKISKISRPCYSPDTCKICR